MDNLTHSFVGWALGQAGLKRKTRKGLAALVLGANAPDVDVFFGWVPWAPLATHRGVTHSLVAGVWVLPILLAVLLWLFDRWQVKRGASFSSGLEMHFGWLVALSYIGCITHPLLDWQTSYAIQLLSPFDNSWFHADTLFIIDVWIWTGMGLAIWLSRKRERAGAEDWRLPPRIALVALVGYVAMNGVITMLARMAVTMERPYAIPDVLVSAPPPVLFWKREAIWRQDRRIYRGQFDPLRNINALQSYSDGVPDGMEDPLARTVLMTEPHLASFRRWSILPMAWVTRKRCTITVRYQDARFGSRPGAGRLGAQATVARGGPGC